MSTALSTRAQGTASRLLSTYGSKVSLVRAGTRAWDADEGEYIFSPETLTPLIAVPVPVNAGLVDGTTIQAGDMIVKADFSIAPTLEDKVDFDGARWSIVAIEKKMVSDDIISYSIQVRK